MKPITMTAEEEADNRAACDLLGTGRERMAYAEIDALRRLPVIATCGDCAHLGADEHCDDEGRWLYCSGGDIARMLPNDARGSVPPAWCPLRGAP